MENINIMVGRTPAEINAWNRQFWREQSELMDQRIRDEVLLELAINTLRIETERRVPIRQQIGFETALAAAESYKKIVLTRLAQKGGKAPKSDALQELILAIVQKNPAISQHQLFLELRKQVVNGTITSIDTESDILADSKRQIHFVGTDGKPKAAPLSGLKDRLARAKAKIKSR